MMPGSPDVGMVNTAGRPMGIFVAGPKSEPVYDAPVDVVGVVAPLSVSSPIDDDGGVAPISFPVAATAEPKRTAATAADAADTPPTTSVRRSRESIAERLRGGA